MPKLPCFSSLRQISATNCLITPWQTSVDIGLLGLHLATFRKPGTPDVVHLIIFTLKHIHVSRKYTSHNSILNTCNFFSNFRVRTTLSMLCFVAKKSNPCNILYQITGRDKILFNMLKPSLFQDERRKLCVPSYLAFAIHDFSCH